MLLGYRSLLPGVCSLLLLSGCGSSSYSSSGSINPTSGGTGGTGGSPAGNPLGGGSGPSGSNNSVVATPSVTGCVSVVVGAKQTVNITFTSSDGRAISGFGISGSLGTVLPAGWSGPGGLTCASISTGSGCVLNLTYAPTIAGSGNLTIDYVFVDNAAMPRTGGSVTLAYAATTHNNVVAAASPTGQIDAVGAGSNQSVSVNFTTDDGNAATNLRLTSDLTALPPGWSSTAASLSCAIVSTGSRCQLPLAYAPTTVAGGTLTLNYSYADNSGTPKTGSVSIPFTAMSSPHLYVAQLGGLLSYCVLNAADGTLSSCASTGNGFSAPAGIVFDGNQFAYVADYGNSAVYVCNAGLDGSLSGCVSTGSNFQNPLQLAIGGNMLYASNANSTSGVTTCSIGVNGFLASCNQSPGAGTTAIALNSGSGPSYAYVGVGPNNVEVCAIGGSGGLTNCAGTGAGFSNVDGISVAGGYAYVANQGNGSNGFVSVCSINPDGSLSNSCATYNIGAMPTDVVIKGGQAYVNDASGNIYLCSVSAGGALTNCTVSNGNATFSYGVQIAVH
jgi:hypothetical protein